MRASCPVLRAVERPLRISQDVLALSSVRKQPVAFSRTVVTRTLASTQAPAQLVAVGEGDRAGFWLGFALPYRQLWPSRGDTLSMAGAIAVEDDGIPDVLNVLTLRCPGNPRTAGVPVPTDGLALIPGISLGGLSNNQVTEWCAWDIKAGNSSVRITAPHVLSGYGIALTRMVALKERTTRPENAVSSAHRPLSCRRFPTPILHPEMDELRKVAVPGFLTIWSNTNTSSGEPFFEHSLAPRQPSAGGLTTRSRQAGLAHITDCAKLNMKAGVPNT